MDGPTRSNKRRRLKNGKVKKEEESGSKAKRSRKSTFQSAYLSAARGIARCVNLWCDVEEVITIARLLEQEGGGNLEEGETSENVRKDRLGEYDEAMRERCMSDYNAILQLAPGLKVVIDDPKRVTELAGIARKMSHTIRVTRSQDACRLKKFIGNYLPLNPNAGSLNPPIVGGTARVAMGLNHPVLARMLCPADKLEDYDEDPVGTRNLLECGEIPMTAENFPALLWSGDNPGDDWDPTDMNKGCFRSYVLVRVARHIFLGPTAALSLRDKKGIVQCNAYVHNMTTVKPEHIAYVCVQAHFVISSKFVWDGKLGFSYREFYRLVVSYIRDAVDERWRDDLLKWWNLQLFGDERGLRVGVGPRDERASSTVEKMRAQMKARTAAVATSSDAANSSRLRGRTLAPPVVARPAERAARPSRAAPRRAASNPPPSIADEGDEREAARRDQRRGNADAAKHAEGPSAASKGKKRAVDELGSDDDYREEPSGRRWNARRLRRRPN